MYPNGEPIDCWHGYAATMLIAGSGDDHPGDNGEYVFRFDPASGRWLLTDGPVASCAPYIPAAYLGYFPHCRT